MPSTPWYDLAKKRTQAADLGTPYADMPATDALALNTVNELLPAAMQDARQKKRTPLRLNALRAMFPSVSYAPTDATGGMR